MKRNFLLWLFVLGFFSLGAQTFISPGELVYGSIKDMANPTKDYEVKLPSTPYTGVLRIDLNVYTVEDNLEVIADGKIVLKMIKSFKQGYVVCTGTDHCQAKPWNWSPREGSSECFPESVAMATHGQGLFLSTGIVTVQNTHRIIVRVFNEHRHQTDWLMILTLSEPVFTIQNNCEFTTILSNHFISVIQNGDSTNLIPGDSIEIPTNALVSIVCNLDCLEKIVFTINTSNERYKGMITANAKKVLAGTQVDLNLVGENWTWLDQPYQPPHRKEILKATTTYWATNMCDTLSTTVEVVSVFVPDVFSPNTDGINDVFCVYTEAEMEEFSFKIFNRFGELVFHASEPKCWDGKYKNSDCPTDEYIYVVQTKFVQKKGGLFLLR